MVHLTTIPAHLNFLETLAAGILEDAKKTGTPLPSCFFRGDIPDIDHPEGNG